MSNPQPTQDDEQSFAVRNIFQNDGKYARVSVDFATFSDLKGMTPKYPFTTTHDKKGRGVRIFDVNGIEVMSRYDKDTRKTSFIMELDTAKAHLRTIDNERANEPGLDFDLDQEVPAV